MVVSLPVGLTQQTLVGVGDPIGSTHRLIVAWAHSVFVTSTLRRYMLKMFKNCVKSAYNTQLSSEIQGFKKILLLHLYNLYNINIISNSYYFTMLWFGPPNCSPSDKEHNIQTLWCCWGVYSSSYPIYFIKLLKSHLLERQDMMRTNSRADFTDILLGCIMTEP